MSNVSTDLKMMTNQLIFSLKRMHIQQRLGNIPTINVICIEKTQFQAKNQEDKTTTDIETEKPPELK